MTGAIDGSEPTCYRHRDRESYILCQRCSRPICPQCQLSAAVGFQCPECVKAGSATVRQPTTMFGGRPPGGRATLTTALVGIGAALYVLAFTGIPLTGRLGFSPHLIWSQPWRLLTFALLPGGSLLPIVGLYGQFLIGRDLEALLGRARLAAVWALSALGALASATWLMPLLPGGSVMAGGGPVTVGLGACWLVLNHRRGRSLSAPAMLLALVLLVGAGVADWRPLPGAGLAGFAAGMILAFTGRSSSSATAPVSAGAGRGRTARSATWWGLAAAAVALMVVSAVGAVFR